MAEMVPKALTRKEVEGGWKLEEEVSLGLFYANAVEARETGRLLRALPSFTFITGCRGSVFAKIYTGFTNFPMCFP